jgi:hypothetical protein
MYIKSFVLLHLFLVLVYLFSWLGHIRCIGFHCASCLSNPSQCAFSNNTDPPRALAATITTSPSRETQEPEENHEKKVFSHEEVKGET